ncbi:universal stress protein [Pleionea litopenaei]|uniref:Universal stress protein n=1 Tax=Pleionea litopenaei TaxID=3070815 RepID=A0AA51RQ32_9GAMM|nr:universal stress protein [Pleionea sp. HL-JVS1]WMS85531.1 universal stress protein [Pleionea sp. HL-JVS1]
MSYKRILVHLDNHPSCDDRLKSGLLLANTFSAEINGIYIEPDHSAELILQSQMMQQNAPLVNANTQAAQQRLEQEKAELQKRISQFEDAALQPLPWRTERGNIRDVLSRFGQFNDIVIMTNMLDEDPLLSIKPPASEVAVNTKSPVLVIPEGLPMSAPLNNILVLWNGQPEASRAIHNALPLFKVTRQVTLFCFTVEQQEISHYLEARNQICEYLHAHNIETTMIDRAHHGRHGRIEQSILETWNQGDYQLVVTGTYDHSKIKELLFSSMTKQLLNHENMPLMLSH